MDKMTIGMKLAVTFVTISGVYFLLGCVFSWLGFLGFMLDNNPETAKWFLIAIVHSMGFINSIIAAFNFKD